MLTIDIITLFPEIFQVLKLGIIGRALQNKLLETQTINPRVFLQEPERVDDRPYGGGPGMVLKYQPLVAAISRAQQKGSGSVIYLTPQGRPFNQQIATRLAQETHLILLCGRYEGIDQRVIDHHVDEELSIGDYVLSGGEFAALSMIDAITRLLPGALGHEDSASYDSFSHGLLDCPHYTRPELIDGHKVPEVLLKGDHAAISRWRHQEALRKTWQMRPDLIKSRSLSAEDQAWLAAARLELESDMGKNQ